MTVALLRIVDHAKSVTVDAGSRVVLGIKVNRSDAKYRWQAERDGKFVDIPGATARTYATYVARTQTFRVITWTSWARKLTSTVKVTVKPRLEPAPLPRVTNRAVAEQSDFDLDVTGWKANNGTRMEHAQDEEAT